MSSTAQEALKLLEKLTGGATIVDNGVGIYVRIQMMQLQPSVMEPKLPQ